MAAKKNSHNSQKKSSLPWGPMLISFAVGAFIMFLLHLKDNVPADHQSKSGQEKKIEKKSAAIEPTFDFYTLLPEMEVVVNTPEQTKKNIVTAPTQQQEQARKKPEQVSYMLQVGSFRKSSDADALKARLAFLGVESKVQKVTIDNKDTWHRVQVGPIIGRDKVDALQKQLKQNDIDSLLMRAKYG